ncbi:MAG: DUF368 domain-containing protein [Bacteriovoracales bacterium]|nr:DUF368 domain-containing protein [Bacteriovoracales bacterium]
MKWSQAIQSSPGPRSKREYLALYAKGFCMGTADLIPGVSGGTIAFISGIYTHFIAALQSLNAKALKELLSCRLKAACAQIHSRFLIALGLGIVSALFLLAHLMHFLITDHPIPTWAFFFSLIASSIPFLWAKLERPRAWPNIVSLSVGGVGAYFLTGLIPLETPSHPLFIAFLGFIAITAMILPGISGSFLLLIFGKYELITGALRNPFDWENLFIMAVFSAGALLGLVSISRLLGRLFKKYPDTMTAFITGLLLGSLRKVWPWKETLETVVVRGKERVLKSESFLPELSLETLMAMGVMIFGVAVIVALNRQDPHTHVKSSP